MSHTTFHALKFRMIKTKPFNSEKNFCKALITIRVVTEERGIKPWFPPFFPHQPVLHFFLPEGSFDEHALKSTFRSKDVMFKSPYALIEWEGRELRCIFVPKGDDEYTKKRLRSLSIFYAYGGFGLALSRFFIQTDFSLGDNGLFYDATGEKLFETMDEVIDFLELPPFKLFESYEDAFFFLRQSPFYMSRKFSELYRYRLHAYDKRLIDFVRRIRKLAAAYPSHCDMGNLEEKLTKTAKEKGIKISVQSLNG